MHSAHDERKFDIIKSLGLLLVLTMLAILVMGYHPGLEDDAFYLAAIKKDLNPALFPHDADFFQVQFQATIFDKLIAFSTRLTHLPLAWAVLLWQLAAVFFLLHGALRISRRCFKERSAQWGAVGLLAILLTIPVTGTGISLADQYLHPRTVATAAILAAIIAVIDRKLWRAGVWLLVGFAIHALVAAFGISLCGFLLWRQNATSKQHASVASVIAAILIPFGWIFEPASDAWRQAAATRSFYFLGHWRWYEWLGVFAPIVLLYAFKRWHDCNLADGSTLCSLLSGLVWYAASQTVVGLVIMMMPGLERLRPFEPMRYLHLIYFFFFLIVGGLAGRFVLERHPIRWVVFFVAVGAGMFYAQRQMYPATEHLELPGMISRNAWVQSFVWIRQNTPTGALFALDPHYMTLPGEDYHGFRALAERSVLADYEKDGGMAARVPRLAPRWLKEVEAQNGWRDFRAADFQRLKAEFGVTWVVLERSKAGENPLVQSSLFTCPYENQLISVCRLY